ncbi:phosphotransferase family protein [Oceanobacillus salinisoli]|uniref:phosphotransferase family protein n=1 Tax=Oceanobacillus salinisoli TaxID=2678611 RepID=UPI0012E2C2A9|nr:phosphotransferase family protein [Oceanobacillus salinisoli]
MSQTNETIDWNVIEHYIQKVIPEVPQEKMKITKFNEGYSNLTYLLEIGEWQGVLRRPPFGYVPPKAHDMEREYRILKKVNPVYPLAPKPYVYCEDPNIMDRHFYIMEKKEGFVIDKEIPSVYGKSPEVGKEISEAIIHALVRLHRINYKTANLEDIGKPEGYLKRQVHGWIRRYQRAKTEEIKYIESVEKWLIENIPNEPEVSIVHNDFKLNNIMLDGQNPGRVVGVFDWELSTIGDPFTDLGSALVYWGEKSDLDIGLSVVTDKPGFYSRREFLEKYALLSGRDVSNIHYYLTFGFYKIAIILQQLHHRWKIGEAKDERFATLNQSVANLIEMANDARYGILL